MTIDRLEAKNKFEDFLMKMDDQLEALNEEALSRGLTLDFSTDDLDRLEKLFDMMSDGLTKADQVSLIVTFARHLGEIVRINFGGTWHLALENESNVNFNTPVIVGHTLPKGLEFSPLSVMRAYALRRKGGTLKRAVDAQISPVPLDLSGLAE